MRVLTNRDVKPSGRVLQLCPAFCLREARWWLQLEVRKTSNLHYTTALHTISPVFSHHTTIEMLRFIILIIVIIIIIVIVIQFEKKVN